MKACAAEGFGGTFHGPSVAFGKARVQGRLAQGDGVRTALGATGSDVFACCAGQAALGQCSGHRVSGRARGFELQRGKSSWSLPRRRGALLYTARRGPRRGYISTSGHQRRGMRQRPPALWVVPASPQCVVTRQLLVPTSAFLAPSLAGSRGQRRGKLQEDLPQGLLHAAQLFDFTLGEGPRQFFGTHVCVPQTKNPGKVARACGALH